MALLYLFYIVFLSGFTFHRLNRVFLNLISLLSVILPFLSGLIVFPGQWAVNLDPSYNYREFINSGEIGQAVNHTIQVWSFSTVLIYVYFMGISFMFLRGILLIRKMILFKKLSVVSRSGKLTIISSDLFTSPFSFFHWIYVPADFQKIPGFESLLMHERTHAEQLHSADLLIMEICSMFFWFNPFVFLLKKSLKRTHEYLADNSVISQGVSTQDYLRLLVSCIESGYSSGLIHTFKSLTIKKRIEMITKNKTPKLRKYIYLLIFPFLILLTVAFSGTSLGNGPPSICPVKYIKITSAFGIERVNPITKKSGRHSGIDLKAPSGTPVVAPASGVIMEAGWDKDYGYNILIRHDKEFETFYEHLQDISVKKGDHVTLGQEIGHVGSTGISTGPHLHYEVIKNGVRVDPQDYFGKQDQN